jgi:tetratricopeptide (TPR) repeat protein
MATTERFSRREFQRMLDVSEKRLSYWEKLELVAPRENGVEKTYDFRDLITLRTAKQLIDTGVSAQRLQQSIVALQRQLAEVKSPLTELRIRSNGRNVIVENAGVHLEPISGQTVLNFETRELPPKVRVMPQRTADEWVALGLEREELSESAAEVQTAAEAYRRALDLNPGHVDALNHLGMLAYEQGKLEEATDLFHRAVQLHPRHAVSHFNLGSVLEECGELELARRQLRMAVQLEPGHADAHYNLAFVCDKAGAYSEGRRHWRKYIELDPDSAWASYARERLTRQK